MISNVVLLLVVLVAAVLFGRYGKAFLAALRRFDSRNAARQAEQFRAQFDPLAHYRQTIQTAEEQIEEVTKIVVSDPRTALPVPRYLFDGKEYATLSEAEAARRDAVVAKARGFYAELDALWLKGRRAYDAQAATLPAPPKPNGDARPPRP